MTHIAKRFLEYCKESFRANKQTFAIVGIADARDAAGLLTSPAAAT